MHIKVFTGANILTVEQDVETWLTQANPDVKFVSQSESMISAGMNTERWITITVFFN